MCDTVHRGLSADFLATLSTRRTFLRASAASVITMVVAPGFVNSALAADKEIASLHGQGFCNLNLFLAAAMNTVKEDGYEIKLITTPTIADTITMIAAGHVDVGVLAYPSFIALRDKGAPVKVIGGGGVGGVGLVAQPGIKTAADVKGKTLATFQMDTLETFAYDWCKVNGIAYRDLNVRYFDTVNSSVQAFMSGDIDLLSTIEPWGTLVTGDKPGATLLSDGQSIYGTREYTDCILGARESMITDNPDAIVALIKGMMKAQHMAEEDPDGTLKTLVGPYYKIDMDRAKIAMEKQPSVVDARNQQDFILTRSETLLEMGYIKKKLDKTVFDWSLLERAIAENPDLYASLKRKSA